MKYWHPDEGIEDDSSMTEQGLGAGCYRGNITAFKSYLVPMVPDEA